MKIIKVILSTLLTIIVIPIIIAFIVYLSANSIMSKKGIEKIVEKVSVSNFLINDNGEYNEAGREIRNELVENGLPVEIVDEFIDSEQITDFISEYAGEVYDYIFNDKELEKLTAEEISKVINDNVDDIVSDLRERKVEGYEELTDERVAEFKAQVDEVSKEIEKSLPDMKKEIDDSEAADAIRIIRFVFGTVVMIAMICIIVLLLLFILLLNLKRYSFLIWYGVIFIFASVPIVSVSRLIPNLAIESDTKAVIDIVNYVFGKLYFYSMIFFILGILSITLAIVLRTIDRANKTS